MRRHAVRAVVAGQKKAVIARRLRVTRQTVTNWVTAYALRGPASFRIRLTGRPRGGKLRPWQMAQIARTVLSRTPDAFDLACYLWTREAIADLIERRFGVRLSAWSVSRHLRRWRVIPRKPVDSALERSPAGTRTWLHFEYPAILRRAQIEKAVIRWSAGMQLPLSRPAGPAAASNRRGRIRATRSAPRRIRRHLLGAIGNRGELDFMVVEAPVRATAFIDFLDRLARQHARRVHLIAEDHAALRSRQVKMWLRDHAGKIRLILLPRFTPQSQPARGRVIRDSGRPVN